MGPRRWDPHIGAPSPRMASRLQSQVLIRAGIFSGNLGFNCVFRAIFFISILATEVVNFIFSFFFLWEYVVREIKNFIFDILGKRIDIEFFVWYYRVFFFCNEMTFVSFCIVVDAL